MEIWTGGFPVCFLFTYTMDTMEIEVDLCLASKRPLEPAETDWRLMEPKWTLPSGGRLRPERVSRATWWLKMDLGPAQDFWPREVKRRQGHLPQRGRCSLEIWTGSFLFVSSLLTQWTQWKWISAWLQSVLWNQQRLEAHGAKVEITVRRTSPS